MSADSSPDDEAVESGEQLVQLGADTLASLGGAAAGSFLGPPGAVAGAAAGPATARALAWAGRAIKRRVISKNEEVRVGTALYVALEKIREREANGEQPRVDGLFDIDIDPRGMLEGTLLTAARSYDEMKVPYLGAFYASFVFEESVGINEGHFLLSLFDRLTITSFVSWHFLPTPPVLRS